MNESCKNTDNTLTSASTSTFALLDESVTASTSRKLKNNRKSFKQEKVSTSSVEDERIQSRKRSIVNDDANDEEEEDDDDENLIANSVETQGIRFNTNQVPQSSIQISNPNSTSNKPLHKQSKRVLYENMGLTQELATCLGVSDLLRSEDDEDNLLSEVDDDDDDDDVDFININNTLNETNTHLKLNDDLEALVNEEDDDEVDEEERETDDIEILNTVSSLSSSSGSVIELRNQPLISNKNSINSNNKSNSDSICTTSSSINNNFSSLYTGELSNLDSTLAENNDDFSETRLLLLDNDEDESSNDEKQNQNDKVSLNDQQDDEQDDIVDDIENLLNDQSARSQLIRSNNATIDESPTSSNSSNNNFSLNYNDSLANTKSKLNSNQTDFKSNNTQNASKSNRSSLITTSDRQLRSQPNAVRPKTPDFNRNNCSTTATTSSSTSSNSYFSASSDFINRIRSSSTMSSMPNNSTTLNDNNNDNNSNRRNIISNLNSLNFLMTNYTPPNINLTYVPQNRSLNVQTNEQQSNNSSNTNSNTYNQPEERDFYHRHSASSKFLIALINYFRKHFFFYCICHFSFSQ